MAESPITPGSRRFTQWYQDVVLPGDRSESAEVVKSRTVIKPNGYAVWEGLQSAHPGIHSSDSLHPVDR